MKPREPLSSAQIAEFKRNGVLVVTGFYDLQADIAPIQRGIHEIIHLVMQRHGMTSTSSPFCAERFDDGYQRLIARNRAYGGEVYDAIKQIPAFVRLLADTRHEALFKALRPNSIPGIAASGYGIRIDNPHEDRFRATWHQEYPAQLRSLDGLVFWSPLVNMSHDLGPVQFCLGSHTDGAAPVLTQPTSDNKTGAYALRLKDEASVIERYPHAAPLTKPGDLVVIDFLTLHASGFNCSQRSRWSLQFRYFNFAESTGLAHGWKGSFAAGVDFRDVHPELCAD